MKDKLFLLIFLQIFNFGVSQSREVPPTIIENFVDSSAVSYYEEFIPTDSILALNLPTKNTVFLKNFETNFQSKYKGEEFDYSNNKPRESVFQKIEKFIKKIIEAIFGNIDANKTSNYAENTIRFFAIVIIGCVLYFLIRFLLNKEGNFFFSKKNKKVHVANQDLHENIHEINFSETIHSFEVQKEYRFAVRYQFLLVLKKLADQKHIQWNPEKTNKDYFAELKNTDLQSDFKDLVYIFDNVWYGEFEINENNYTYFTQKFLQFKA